MWAVIHFKKIAKTFLIAVLIILTYYCLINPQRSIFTTAEKDYKGLVAFVIDDFGNSGQGSNEMMKLGIPMTAAVMPFLNTSVQDSETAHKMGMEVIMHVSMEPVFGNPEWLGPRSIKDNSSDQDVISILQDGLKQLKYAVGINNHMGSKVMQNKRIVSDILNFTKKNNIFFLNSKTGINDITAEVSSKYKIKYLSRDIFLDNESNKTYIKNQIRKLANISLTRGYAIGIGHVGPQGGTVTAESIKEMIPELTKEGIKFVYVSDLIKYTK